VVADDERLAARDGADRGLIVVGKLVVHRAREDLLNVGAADLGLRIVAAHRHLDPIGTAPLAQLAPKGEATFRVRAQGLRPGDQRVTLQVTTDEVREPIIEVESTQVYADE
jgi:hypothetical protein